MSIGLVLRNFRNGVEILRVQGSRGCRDQTQVPILNVSIHIQLTRDEVASFEVFIDLLYVGAIGAAGDTASEHTSSAALIHYSTAEDCSTCLFLHHFDLPHIYRL